MNPEIAHVAGGGRPSARLRRLLRDTGRGINEFAMIGAGDRVIVGISGGKDSLTLALALSLRRRHLPISYEVEAVHVDWREHALAPEQLQRLQAFFDAIEVPFRSIPMSMFPPSFKGRFDCYLCARNRKRVLFDVARERDASLVAFGHHLDDIVETTLMNICFRGSFATMKPVQELFGGALRIIRPLCRVGEREISAISDYLQLPVASIDCPLKQTNVRTALKPIVRELQRCDKRVRDNIFRAGWNINFDYLPQRPH